MANRRRKSKEQLRAEAEYPDSVRMQKDFIKAIHEGRVDGPYVCPLCGMKHNIEDEAVKCCRRTPEV